MKNYRETSDEFERTKNKFAEEVRQWNEESKRHIQEYLELKIQRHLRVTEALSPEPEVVEEGYLSVVRPLPELTLEMRVGTISSF